MGGEKESSWKGAYMKKLTAEQWEAIAIHCGIETIGEIMKITGASKATIQGVEQSNSYEHYMDMWAQEQEEKEKRFKQETQDALAKPEYVIPRTIREIGEQLDRIENQLEEINRVVQTVK